MASASVDRSGVLGKLVLAVYVASWQWLAGQASPYYFPTDGYQAPQYYYNAPAQSDSWAQPPQNGYYYAPPSNTVASRAGQTETGGSYNGRINYYGIPGYDDYRTSQANRYVWNDPYVRRQWNNYYRPYYYSLARPTDSWDNRRDGQSPYYFKRRQDAGPPLDATTPAPATVSLRPSVPRKKKLFVPNVWG